MINKVLRRNISPWQIAGYGLATFIGLAIVAVAVQFYNDMSAALGGGRDATALMDKRRMVISRRVGIRDAFRGETPSFTDADIADIASRPWAGEVIPFTAADFGVRASVNIGNRTMATSLFFESLPDRLIDIDSLRWRFDPSQPVIPVMIPRDYLALYNFGFAASGGMPAVSESMLSGLPLRVTIDGNGMSETFDARIVGYSDWLNTIAVPESFMRWAHARYGRSHSVSAPSRLVVEVSDPADPAAAEYMRAHGYEVAGPSQDISRASHFLAVATSVVITVGGLITLLALCILVLSLYLLVQKNRRAISGLLMLGYTPGQISSRYIAITLAVNGGVLLLVCAALVAARPLWAAPLEQIGAASSSPVWAIVVATGVVAAVSVVNVSVLARLVRGCFRS